jgi:uncharacterized protein (TIGR00251 family)
MPEQPSSDEALRCTVNADGVTFTVHVQPRASRAEICGLHNGELKVRLTAPPVDDAANAQCVELLAKRLGVAKSAVTIRHGSKSRHKTICVTGASDADIHRLLEPH